MLTLNFTMSASAQLRLDAQALILWHRENFFNMSEKETHANLKPYIMGSASIYFTSPDIWLGRKDICAAFLSQELLAFPFSVEKKKTCDAIPFW